MFIPFTKFLKIVNTLVLTADIDQFRDFIRDEVIEDFTLDHCLWKVLEGYDLACQILEDKRLASTKLPFPQGLKNYKE